MFKKDKFAFLIILALIIAQASFASDAPVNNVVRLGGTSGDSCLTLPSNNQLGYFAVFGYSTNASTAARLFKNGVFYQVDPAKTFEVVCAVFHGDSAGDRFQILSDDTTFTQDQAVNTLNAPLFQGGASLQYPLQVATANVDVSRNFPLTIAASRFVGFQSNASNFAVTLIGRETP